MPEFSRRSALLAAAGTGLILANCSKSEPNGEISATEDLMREHGILRRILIVYRETAPKLRDDAANFDAAALGQAAQLFRQFGEDYHERKLEEAHVFPALRKPGAQGQAVIQMIDVLLSQHDRGRQITAFIQDKCGSGKIGAGDAEPVARAMEGFTRMYEAHTAFEDTIIFQAWRQSMSAEQMKEMSEKFEGIEHEQFKGDGFDIAQSTITDVEKRLNLNNLQNYTAQPPGSA